MSICQLVTVTKLTFFLQNGFPADVGQCLCDVSVSTGVPCGTSVALNRASLFGHFVVNIITVS